jgi:hypothetical protein
MEKEEVKTCEVCDKECSFDIECPSPKNGYCWKFNLQAKVDKHLFNVRDRTIHTDKTCQ